MLTVAATLECCYRLIDGKLAEFRLTDDPERTGQLGVANPFYDVVFDFALARAGDTKKCEDIKAKKCK